MALPHILRGLALPVIGSPLFIISNPDLVIAQCKAGVVGAFPALNARPEGALEDWLKRITDALGEHDSRYPHRRAARSRSIRSCTAPTNGSAATSSFACAIACRS